MKCTRKQERLPRAVREARHGLALPKTARDRLNTGLGNAVPGGLFHIGNTALLEQPLTAFFCSVRCPGNLILKAYDLAQKWRAENQPVIGGFHSPVEREVLRILLRSSVPVCIVLARSLPKRVPPEFRRPLDEGRLLLLSPFDARTKRATQETGVRRNQLVAALADKVFVAYAAPGSKTETFCRAISKWTKPCFTFQSQYTENLVNMGFSAIDPKAGAAPSKLR